MTEGTFRESGGVVLSLPSPSSIAVVLAEAWDLRVDRIRVMHHNVNDHYLVETPSGRMVATAFGANHTDDSLAFCLGFADHLMQAGIAVSAPQRTAAGDLYVPIETPEGRRGLALSTFAPGRSVRYSDAQAYGRALARLHQAGRSFSFDGERRALDSAFLVHDRLDQVLELFSHRSDTADWIEGFAQRVEGGLADCAAGASSDDVCHGDTHGGNASIADADVCFYDFEFSAPGTKLYDVATYRWGMKLHGADDAATWVAFLDGYRSIEEISADGLDDRLIILMAARTIFLLGHWAGVDSKTPGLHAIADDSLDWILRLAQDLDQKMLAS